MADYFEVANCLVNLGGDALNSVPKYRVTAGEIAVLQIIHGNDAVFEIKPLGKIERSQRVERDRLRIAYGKAKDSEGNSLFEKLYPGAAARVFERLDELALVTEQFAAVRVGRGGSERQAAAVADAAKAAGLLTVKPDEVIPFGPGEEPRASGNVGADANGEPDVDDLPADDAPLEDPAPPAADTAKGDDAFA